jgi:predicted amidohydrolase
VFLTIFAPLFRSSWATPCDESEEWKRERPALAQASCAARSLRVSMVYGCIDVQPCTHGAPNRYGQPCPDDGMFIWNAAVAIDEEGRLVAKYHKRHLFFTMTDVFNIPTEAQVRFFELRNGVRVGIFICFDSMFAKPVLDLVGMGIRHFAFPTSWVNLPPLLSATQWQQAWSRHFGSAFIAANNGASRFSSGSGIYFNGTVDAAFFNATLDGSADEKLLVADVPVHVNTAAPKQMMPLGKSQNRGSSGRIIGGKPEPPQKKKHIAAGLCGTVPGDCKFFTPTPGSKGKLTATDGNLTCSAVYSVSPSSRSDPAHFALVSTSSWVWVSQWVQVQICGVVRCVDDVVCVVLDPFLESVYTDGSVFDELAISGDFAPEVALFPLGATDGGQVMPPESIKEHNIQPRSKTVDPEVRVQQSLPLINAAIFGRVW